LVDLDLQKELVDENMLLDQVEDIVLMEMKKGGYQLDKELGKE
jgi:hypothetical protein